MARKDNTMTYVAVGGALLLLGGIALMGRKSSAATKSQSSDGGDGGRADATPTAGDVQHTGGVLYDQLARCYEEGLIAPPAAGAPVEYAAAVGQAIQCLVDYYEGIGVNIPSLSGPQRDQIDALFAEVAPKFVSGIVEGAPATQRRSWVQFFNEVVTAINPANIPMVIMKQIGA